MIFVHDKCVQYTNNVRLMWQMVERTTGHQSILYPERWILNEPMISDKNLQPSRRHLAKLFCIFPRFPDSSPILHKTSRIVPIQQKYLSHSSKSTVQIFVCHWIWWQITLQMHQKRFCDQNIILKNPHKFYYYPQLKQKVEVMNLPSPKHHFPVMGQNKDIKGTEKFWSCLLAKGYSNLKP